MKIIIWLQIGWAQNDATQTKYVFSEKIKNKTKITYFRYKLVTRIRKLRRHVSTYARIIIKLLWTNQT